MRSWPALLCTAALAVGHVSQVEAAPKKKPNAPAKSEAKAEAPAPPADPGLVYKTDFDKLEPGRPPKDFLIAKGPFTVAEGEGNRALRLEGQPIDGCVIQAGTTFKGAGSVRARIKAESQRRVHPMFGVGLHGQSGFYLRAAPASKQLELVRREEIVAAVPMEWKSGEWFWMELAVGGSEGRWTVEGRLWPKDGERPVKAQISHFADDETLSGRATLRGSQYSGHDLWYDEVEVRKEVQKTEPPAPAAGEDKKEDPGAP